MHGAIIPVGTTRKIENLLVPRDHELQFLICRKCGCVYMTPFQSKEEQPPNNCFAGESHDPLLKPKSSTPVQLTILGTTVEQFRQKNNGPILLPVARVGEKPTLQERQGLCYRSGWKVCSNCAAIYKSDLLSAKRCCSKPHASRNSFAYQVLFGKVQPKNRNRITRFLNGFRMCAHCSCLYYKNTKVTQVCAYNSGAHTPILKRNLLSDPCDNIELPSDF